MARKKMSRRKKQSKKSCAIATKSVKMGGKTYQVRVYKRKNGGYVANIVTRTYKQC